MVNILIAEDDKDHFLFLEEAIEKTVSDCRITRSKDGKECLQNLAEDLIPDMIFLDLNLPKKNGLDCLKEIRRNKSFRSTPVIIYSTSSSFEDIDLCYKNGCTLYLVKPPSFKVLLSQVQKLFSQNLLDQNPSTSDKDLHAVIEGNPVCIYEISADWNEICLLAEKDFPSSNSRLTTDWIRSKVPIKNQLQLWEAFKTAAASGKTLELEHQIIKEDGAVGWVFFRATPVRDHGGEILKWMGISHDITSQKQTEEDLKEEHDFLQQITDNTPHLIYVYDLDEKGFIYINRRIEELTGLDPEYVYGMGQKALDYMIHPEDLGRRIQYLTELALMGEGDVRENEFRVRDGNQYRWLRSKDRVFKSNKGKVFQVIGLAEDISFEKQLLQKIETEKRLFGLN